jgi:hypothetical protein
MLHYRFLSSAACFAILSGETQGSSTAKRGVDSNRTLRRIVDTCWGPATDWTPILQLGCQKARIEFAFAAFRAVQFV